MTIHLHFSSTSTEHGRESEQTTHICTVRHRLTITTTLLQPLTTWNQPCHMQRHASLSPCHTHVRVATVAKVREMLNLDPLPDEDIIQWIHEPHLHSGSGSHLHSPHEPAWRTRSQSAANAWPPQRRAGTTTSTHGDTALCAGSYSKHSSNSDTIRRGKPRRQTHTIGAATTVRSCLVATVVLVRNQA